ncbi:MAG: hypothetical protein ACE361_00880 [Aureliella sp.]
MNKPEKHRIHSGLVSSSLVSAASAALLLVVVAGCRNQLEEESHTASRITPPTDATKRVETNVQQTDSKSTVPVARIALEPPAGWSEPIAEDEQFFQAPELPKEIQQVVEATSKHASVRLLGFATGSPATPGKQPLKKAIIKIGDSMHFMVRGEIQAGVELIDMGERTVQLQRGTDRWNLGLMQQPLVNKGIVSKPNNRRRRSRTSARNASPSPFRQPEPVSIPGMPELEAAPALPGVEMFEEVNEVDLLGIDNDLELMQSGAEIDPDSGSFPGVP